MPLQSASDIRVAVASDGSVAELHIPEAFDASSAGIELVTALIHQAGVVVTQSVREAAEAALAAATPGAASRHVIAISQRPTHGIDGRVEWLLPGLDQASRRARAADQPEEVEDPSGQPETASHYDRSVFVMVEAGTPIARIHPPTLGEDGSDVKGRILSAKQGKPAPITLDDSLSINSSGIVAAEVNGAVMRAGHAISVRNLLDIDDNVDFSTGNISFDGSVRIRREIKDLFVVDCSGSIEVGGLIQAATIRCGGDLIARGGMAGRERGSIDCRGSITGRYFDAARIEVQGNLSFERELINCETIVGGSIESPRGSIIGGSLQVAGLVHIGNIGSKGSPATSIVVGAVPKLQSNLGLIKRLLQELDQREAANVVELRRLREPGKKLTPGQIERQTELTFYEQIAIRQRKRLHDARGRLEARIAELSIVDVRIERMLYHGARFVVGDIECRITKDTKGPLRITRDSDGMPVYQIGNDSNRRLLTDLGEARLLQQAA